MNKYEQGVPFDPGYSSISVYLPEHAIPFLQEMESLKAPHQKKFRLSTGEKALKSLINISRAFYLGCMLWGAYVHYRFKDSPRNILDNPYIKLNEEEAGKVNVNQEIDFTKEFLIRIDKDYKYFLKKPLDIDKNISEILESYREFANINNNFLKTASTSDIKIPNSLKHIQNLSNAELDILHDKIYEVIKSEKLDNLLSLGFYRI